MEIRGKSNCIKHTLE